MKNVKSKTKRRNQVLFTTIFLLFLFLGMVPSCNADLIPCGTPENPEACTLCHLFVLLNNIFIYFLTFILPFIATILIAWGGFSLLVSGEDRNKYAQAKSIITATVIGLVIILTSWLFLNMFLSYIGVAKWTNLETWWRIECNP